MTLGADVEVLELVVGERRDAGDCAVRLGDPGLALADDPGEVGPRRLVAVQARQVLHPDARGEEDLRDLLGVLRSRPPEHALWLPSPLASEASAGRACMRLHRMSLAHSQEITGAPR